MTQLAVERTIGKLATDARFRKALGGGWNLTDVQWTSQNELAERDKTK